MPRTTPPRPLDVEALFPGLAAHRGTTTRLHPRPGRPEVTDSSVGGPLLWPADEPWPVCPQSHGPTEGRRPADVHERRRVVSAAWRRAPESGPTDEDRKLLAELDRTYRAADADPLPLIGVAQLHRRDVPDLAPGPDGCDLLQVFWCPFDAHGPTGHGMHLDLRWRRAAEVTEVLASPPRPEVVGFDGYVAEPCVLHPEQVATYPYAGVLPDELGERIDAWEEAVQEVAEKSDDAEAEDEEGPVLYQYDLSIPPGWRVGGHPSWHLTDPYAMDCGACATPMDLLLTVDSSEWDGGTGSWRPLEEDPDAPAHLTVNPTEVVVGRWGELDVFACPADPAHPHRWSIQ
ncbi:hypothetical protein [Streptomyces sp. NPDC060194]|uniref:hypothetical protein n=1 Tax=Streptomyces sp. NPDC060194 TaxID=3347069 RepID=UPI00365413C5